MELDIKIGGISYNVALEVEEHNTVIAVNGVSVWDGKKYVEVDMTEKELEEFYEMYVDQINEATMDHIIAREECAAEAHWESANDR